MKYLFSFFITTIIAVNGFAQEVGVGVSAQGDRTIYVPIKIDETFRVEPSIYYYKNKDTGDYNSTSESYELMIGIFNLSQQSDKSKIYYGARAGYSAYHYKYNSNHEHFEGYKIAPTIGLEYLLVENLTVAGDVSLNYSNLNGNDRTRENTTTDTELSVRYYF